MVSRIRRVVMGESADGGSVFTHVEDVAPRADMPLLYDVWGWDELPVLPQRDAAAYAGMSVLPADGGTRIMVLTLPVVEDDSWSGETQARYAVEGVNRDSDGAIPGFHSTDSIDIAIVMSGRIAAVGTGGTQEVLEPGDIYVQNGAPHAWRNVGDEEARLAAVVLGTRRA